MFVSMLLSFFCVLKRINTEDLCERVKIKYIIGKATTILDIEAEEISSLHISCYKEVIIPGARQIQMRVKEAEFGFNKAYEYNGLTGTAYKPVYDRIEVNFGNCSTIAQGLEIRAGLNVKFESDILCLHIQPEVEYRALGAHSPGGRVRIDVTVDIATCSPIILFEQNICQQLCNQYGVLNTCNKGSTVSHVSTVQQSTPTKFTEQIYYLTTSTENKPALRRTTTSILTLSNLRTLVVSPSTQFIYTSDSSSISTSQTLPTILRFSSTSAIPKDVTSINHNTNPLPDISSTNKTQAMHVTGTLSTSTDGITKQNVGDRNAEYKTDNFGLLEGLYVIAGCIVILLLLGIVAFLVRRRRKHDSTSGSNTGTVFRSGLHWRDNWLVRYHTDEIPNDSFSQPESEIQYVRTSCLNRSNTESQYLNQSEYPEVIKYKLNDNPYDNPWPLVRLDSDFVRNTKKVECGNENIKIIRNVDKELNDSEHSDDSLSNHHQNFNEIFATEDGGLNTAERKLETTNEDEKCPRYRLQKHFGPSLCSKRKYNVQKVERSNSKKGFIKSHTKNNMKTYLNHIEEERKRSDSRNHSESNMTKHTSQKRSSSMRSNNASTFEEMMRDEIKTIEDAMDIKGNTDSDRYEHDSKRGSDLRRNWKVNTLYAVVSSRSRMPSHEVLFASKPLPKLQEGGFNLSESENSNYLARKHLAKTGSNSSQKSCNVNKSSEMSSNKSEDVKRSAYYDGINNTYTKTLDLGQDCQFEIPVFDNSKENNKDSNDQAINTSCEHSDIINTHSTRNIFLENRQTFEDNGSIMPYNNKATGTGQFPK